MGSPINLAHSELAIGELGEWFMVPPAIIVRTVTGAVPPSDGHDVAAGDDLLAEQVAYYHRGASEYDVTAYGDETRRGPASPEWWPRCGPSTVWSKCSSTPARRAPACTSSAGRAASAGTVPR